MVDPDSVRAKLARLDREVEALREIHARGREAFLAEPQEESRVLAERHLQLAEQACIDVGLHLAAEAGLSPTRYKEIFSELVKAGALDSDLGAWLQGAAGQRNILIHMYEEVDYEEIWTTLEELDRFEEFAAVGGRLAGLGEE